MSGAFFFLSRFELVALIVSVLALLLSVRPRGWRNESHGLLHVYTKTFTYVRLPVCGDEHCH